MSFYSSGAFYLNLPGVQLPVSGVQLASVSFWINVVSGYGNYGDGNNSIFTLGGSQSFSVPFNSNGTALTPSVTAAPAVASTAVPFQPTNNNFIALLFNSTGNTQTIYANNQFISTTAWTPPTNFPNAVGITVGSTNNVENAVVIIQDVAMWSGYTLTKSDCLNLYTRALNPSQIGPSAVIWYPFSASGNTIAGTGLKNYGTGGAKYNLTTIINPGGAGTGYWSNTNLTQFGAVGVGQAYIAQSSGLVVFIFNNPTTNNYSYNPTVFTDPILNITRTGNTFQYPLPSGQAVTDKSLPLIMYSISPSAILSTDIVTYSSVLGWAQTNDGTLFGGTGSLANYAGGNLWTITPSSNLSVGFNVGRVSFNNTNLHKNVLNQIIPPLNNCLAYTSDFYPIVISGTSTNTVCNSATNVYNTNEPIYTGVWTLDYNDTVANSSSLTLSAFLTQGNFTFIPGTSFTNITSGSIYSRLQYNLSYSTSTGSMNAFLSLNWTPSNTGSIHVSNIRVIPPNNLLDVYNPYDIEQTFLSQVSTTGGKFTPSLRFMGYNFDTTTTMNSWVELSDYVNPTGFTWCQSGIILPVQYLQPYKITTNTQLPFSQQVVNPSLLGYTDLGFLCPFANGYNRTAMEVVCLSGNYDLKSGRVVGMSANTHQGTTTTTDGTFVWNNVKIGSTIPIFSPVLATSPSSFLYVYGNGVPISGVVPTLQSQVLPTGLVFTLNPPIVGIGMAPYEYSIAQAAQISGCTPWINLPIGMSDSLATHIAQQAYNILPSGRKIAIELGNEHWNSSFPMWSYLNQWGSLTQTSNDVVYTIRAGQLHNIFDAVFSSGGRPNSVERIFGTGDVDTGSTATIVNTCLANNIPITAVHIAIYFDTSLLSSTSTFSGVSAYAPMDIYHDIIRHYITYSNSYPIQNHLIYLDNYKAITGTGISMYAYEFALDAPITPNTPNANQRFGDWKNSPEMYNTTIATYNWAVKNRLDKINRFALNDIASFVNADFSTLTWPQQSWGRGDGSDGKFKNVLMSADGHDHTIDNVNPELLAWKDYLQTVSGVPSFNVKPVVTSINPISNSVITGVPPINIVFNKGMDATKLNINLQTSTGSSVPISIVTSDSYTYTIKPTTNLSSSTKYNLSVSGVDLVGISQSTAFQSVFNFIAPVIVSYFPSGGIPVNINTNIYAIFSENVQSGTINFSVVDVSGVSVPGHITYNSGTFQANFAYTPPLTFNDVFSVNISGVTDFNTLTIPPSSFSFSTVPQPVIVSTSPVGGSTNNLITTPIYAQFNENISSGSISFSLKDSNNNVIPGNVSYGNNQANYVTAFPLNLNSMYSAKVTGVTDSFGNLIPTTTWSFTTELKENGNANLNYRITVNNPKQYNSIEILLQ